MSVEKMNESGDFSLARFGQLLMLNVREEASSIFMPMVFYLLAFIGACYLVFYSKYGFTVESFQGMVGSMKSSLLGAAFMVGVSTLMIMVLFAGFIIIYVNASKSFARYHIREKATMMMMLPASRLEKFLVPFVLFVLLVPLVYCGVTFLGIAIGVQHVISSFAVDNPLNAPVVTEDLKSDMAKVVIIFLRYLMLWPSVYFAGSIWFKKHAFMKTVGVVVVFYIILVGMAVNGITILPENISDNSADYAVRSLVEVLIVISVMLGLAWYRFKRHVLP